MTKTIKVAARKSPLSKSQVDEVLLEIQKHDSSIVFETSWMDTTGDIDLSTSLKTLEKTNFFTKEIDDFLLQRKCQIAVHSAKDLPEILEKELSLIAITKGVDPRDSLVLKEGFNLSSLPKGALIATSSLKREEAIRNLRNDLTFTDIRGPIHKRLEVLHSKNVYGVVIAEAALIRLKLTNLNRLILENETTPHQGQLAILAHFEDHEMKRLFSVLDSR